MTTRHTLSKPTISGSNTASIKIPTPPRQKEMLDNLLVQVNELKESLKIIQDKLTSSDVEIVVRRKEEPSTSEIEAQEDDT